MQIDDHLRPDGASGLTRMAGSHRHITAASPFPEKSIPKLLVLLAGLLDSASAAVNNASETSQAAIVSVSGEWRASL